MNCLSVCLSIRLSVCLSLCLSIPLSVSVCLPVTLLYIYFIITANRDKLKASVSKPSSRGHSAYPQGHSKPHVSMTTGRSSPGHQRGGIAGASSTCYRYSMPAVSAPTVGSPPNFHNQPRPSFHGYQPVPQG